MSLAGGFMVDGWGLVGAAPWMSVVTLASVFWGVVSPPRAAAVSLAGMRDAQWPCHPQPASPPLLRLLPPHGTAGSLSPL